MDVLSIMLFLFFVGIVLGLSFYFARKAKSSSDYYAAGGKIHWSVNGIAFAGDYLSAASFLGICGMIATMGYDGFLYSIGYLAGWVVALFVVSEPMNGCSTTRVFGSCMHTEGTLARPFKPAILRTDARGTVQKGFWLRRV